MRFVATTLGGWDTHQDNFTRLKTNLLPKLDTGLAALFNGLEQKGLLESTVVFVTGEFGRTPKINTRSAEGGRDHYPRCMFMLMAGGGMRGGQVIGESDDTGIGPEERSDHARRRGRVVLSHPGHRPHAGIPDQHRPADYDRPRRDRDSEAVFVVGQASSLP